MRSSRPRGQATIEYVAVVAVVALVLGGAATAIAAPEIPRRIVHTIRLGICTVANGICSTAQAKARGLDPCVVANWDRTRSSGVSLAVLRLGGSDNWVVARRSDGTRLLSYLPGFDVTGSIGAGLSLGPRFHIGASAAVGLSFGAGKAWELPDERALRRFIERIDDGVGHSITPWGRLGTPPARIHYQEGGMPITAEAGVTQDGQLLAGGRVHARRALGRRSGPDGITWYYDGGATLATALGGVVPGFDRTGQVVAEWHPSKPPRLTLRATTGREDRVTETVSTLALDDPGDGALVRRWALGQTAPGLLPFTARDLASRLAEHGRTQRFTYAQRSTSTNHDLGLSLGKHAVGLDRSRTLVERTLVGAELLGPDGPVAREDCLGLGRG